MEEDLPLADTFTDRARKAFALARKEGDRLGAQALDPSLLLLGMLQEGKEGGEGVLEEAGLRARPFRKMIQEHCPSGAGAPGEGFSPMLEQAITVAYGLAAQMGHELVGVEHLILGILAVEDPLLVRLVGEAGIEPEDLSRSVLEAMQAL